MSAYYNEFDPKAAAWLRSLIAAGLIAPGEVDTRSIAEVRADDLKGFEQCHFFAGIGGWSLALRYAGWPDTRPVWTGSCPCQPFSLAGKQKGFDDSRHLWPQFARLIRDAGPPDLFGEQVASASDWLGIVRGDLDAMGYAVGAMPIEAASAGADHLRDRFWFVGHNTRFGRREGWPEHEFRSRRSTTASDGGLVNAESERRHGRQDAAGPHGRPGAETASGVGLADADHARSQGRTTQLECAGERLVGQNGVADTVRSERWTPAQGRNVFDGHDARREETASGFAVCGEGNNLADSHCDRERRITGEESCEARQGESEMGHPHRERFRLLGVGTCDGYEWAIGADGKARRIKPGVRLLVNGFPCRVGLLRGFGNAIDPRPASAFIKAASEAIMFYEQNRR